MFKKKALATVSVIALILSLTAMLPVLRSTAAPTGYRSFDFTSGAEGFGINTADHSSGTWDCRAPGSDGSLGIQFWSDNGGWVDGPDRMELDAATADRLRVRLKNAGPNDVPSLSVWFTTETETAWTSERAVTLEIEPASAGAEYREYTADLSAVSGWTGTVRQLRLVLGTGPRTTAQSNWLYIDYIRLESSSALAYTFDDGLQGWGYGTADQAGGIWDCRVPGTDGSFGMQFWSDNGGYMNSPDNLNLDASAVSTACIRLKNAGPNDVDAVYLDFITTADTAFDTVKRIPFAVKKASENAGYVEYAADLSAVSSWTGTIRQLRFSTGTGARTAAEPNWIYIDSIRLEPSVTTPVTPPTPPVAAATILEYTFDDGQQGWGYGIADQAGGIWDCRVPGTDGSFGMQFWSDDGGYMNSPDNLGMSAAAVNKVTVRVKNAGPNDVDKLYVDFTTEDDPDFDTAKRLTFTIKKASESTAYAEYSIDPSAVSGWTGTIRQLRLTTGTGARTTAEPNWLYIDRLSFYGAADKNADLSSLSVEGFAFDNGAFTPAGREYTLTVNNSVDRVTIAAGAAAEGASVTGTGEKTLAVGKNEFTVTVTAADGVTVKSYRITVIRREAVDAADATLRSLSVTPGDLAFDPEKTEYTLELIRGTKTVSIAAEAKNENAVVAGTGSDLEIGENGARDFAVTVTAADQTTTKTYTIHVRVSRDYGFTFNDNTVQGWTIGVEGAPVGASIKSLTGENGALRMELDNHYGWMTRGGMRWDTADSAMRYMVIRVSNQTDIANELHVWFATDQNPDMYAEKDGKKTQKVDLDIMSAEEYDGYWEYGFDMSRLDTWEGQLTELRFDVGFGGEGNPSGILLIDSILFTDSFTEAERPDPEAGKNRTGSYTFDEKDARDWKAAETDNNGVTGLTAADGWLRITLDGNGAVQTDNLAVSLNAGDRPHIRLTFDNQLVNAGRAYIRFATDLFPDMDDIDGGEYTQRVAIPFDFSQTGVQEITVDMSQNIRWLGILQSLRLEFVGRDGEKLSGTIALDSLSLPQTAAGGESEDGDASDGSDIPVPDTGVAWPTAVAAVLAVSAAVLTVSRKRSR